MALKILHTADWHLGLRYPWLSRADGLQLTRARLDVVDRLLDLAESRDVDALLVAGDVFDDPHPDEEWWQGLLERLERRSWQDRGRPLVLLPGNHDPLVKRSVWMPEHPFRRGLPSWVHVVDRDEFVLEVADGAAVIHAAPCRSKAGSADLAMRLPRREAGDERVRIGLVHGQTFDLEGSQTNFPIDPAAAVERGFDYLALGDSHGFQDKTPDGPAPTLYPGTPEPMKFRDTEAGSAALVFFPRRGRRPLVQREKVGQWTWRQETLDELAALRRLQGESLRHTVLHLRLELRVTLAEHAEVETILQELEGTVATHGRAGILEVDRSGLEIVGGDVEDFPDDLPEVLQATVEKLRGIEAAASTERERAEARRALVQLYKLVRED